MASSPTLIFTGLPPKTFIGLDLLSFNSAPNFHGIKDVPVGLHFVYNGTDASLSIRSGRWLDCENSKTVHVLEWLPQEESLSILENGSDKARLALSKLGGPKPLNLISYTALENTTANLPAEATGSNDESSGSPINTDWPVLTSHISLETVSRIAASSTLTSISSSPADAENIPGLTHSEALSALPSDSHLELIPINVKQTWASGDIGSVRTERARDHSWYLGHLMESVATTEETAGDDSEASQRQAGAKALLGELQFTFLMILTLANYSCLEQWKRILTVVLNCKTALVDAEAYFVEFLKVLALQMAHGEDVDGGLFELREESGSAWLRGLVRRFRSSVEDVLGDKEEGGTRKGDLLKQLEHFEELMNDRYGWELGKGWSRRGMVQLDDGETVEVSLLGADEDDEVGDWAPTVVDS